MTDHSSDYLPTQLNTSELSVVLLHADQLDKQGAIVTTSLTMIDVHDIARSSCTFGVHTFYVAHPSSLLRRLSRTLQRHWDEGFGSTYNPNRKQALTHTRIVASLDEAIGDIDLRWGRLPRLVATSAHRQTSDPRPRLTFEELRRTLIEDPSPYLLMLGTGWGMRPELVARADLFLEPVCGPGEYNHLSVRAAAGIMLDRLKGVRSSREQS